MLDLDLDLHSVQFQFPPALAVSSPHFPLPQLPDGVNQWLSPPVSRVSWRRGNVPNTQLWQTGLQLGHNYTLGTQIYKDLYIWDRQQETIPGQGQHHRMLHGSSGKKAWLLFTHSCLRAAQYIQMYVCISSLCVNIPLTQSCISRTAPICWFSVWLGHSQITLSNGRSWKKRPSFWFWLLFW